MWNALFSSSRCHKRWASQLIMFTTQGRMKSPPTQQKGPKKTLPSSNKQAATLPLVSQRLDSARPANSAESPTRTPPPLFLPPSVSSKTPTITTTPPRLLRLHSDQQPRRAPRSLVHSAFSRGEPPASSSLVPDPCRPPPRSLCVARCFTDLCFAGERRRVGDVLFVLSCFVSWTGQVGDAGFFFSCPRVYQRNVCSVQIVLLAWVGNDLSAASPVLHVRFLS